MKKGIAILIVVLLMTLSMHSPLESQIVDPVPDDPTGAANKLIQTVTFDEQTWVNGDGVATKSPTASSVNMYVTQMLVLINNPTNANNIDMTIVNADDVTLATINNMADNTDHFKSGLVSIQDFPPFAANGTLTCNLTNSAAVGGTSMTCTVKLEGR